MALQQSIPVNSTEVNKAFLTTDDAAELFSHLYTMPKPTSVTKMDGYDTQNFLIEIESDLSNGDTPRGKFLRMGKNFFKQFLSFFPFQS